MFFAVLIVPAALSNMPHARARRRSRWRRQRVACLVFTRHTTMLFATTKKELPQSEKLVDPKQTVTVLYLIFIWIPI